MPTWRASSRSSLIVFSHLDLNLHASRRLAVLLALPWLASYVILIWLKLPIWLLAAALPLHLGMARYQIRLLALNASANSVIALHLSQSIFHIELGNGDELLVTLKPDSFVSRRFCVLRFEHAESRQCHSMILCCWNLRQPEAMNQLRRLRVNLRFDPTLMNSPEVET